MRHAISFEKAPDYVLVQTFGEGTVPRLEAVLLDLLRSPLWVKGTNIILDHRGLDMSAFTLREMAAIKLFTETQQQRLGKGCCAFVVSGPLGVGLTRQYESVGGDHLHGATEVFETIEQAAAWLRAHRPAMS